MIKLSDFGFLLLFVLGSFILINCEKEEPEPESNIVTDYDGNEYHTVKIFTEIWMAENLRTSRLNDGTSIEIVSDVWNWDFLDKPKRCYYNNDGPAYRNVYGHLYNYYAVNSKMLCPVGWHVPTKVEWQTLIGYLGGYSVAGGKLKELGTSHWSEPNTGADNSGNFSGLPGGFRNRDGIYSELGYTGVWWCSDRSVLKLTYNDISASMMSIFTSYYGASVRCIKDD